MNLDALQTFDKSILLAFNGGENIFLDSFVLTLTSAYTWIPLYASLLYLVIKNNENWQKIILHTIIKIEKIRSRTNKLKKTARTNAFAV